MTKDEKALIKKDEGAIDFKLRFKKPELELIRKHIAEGATAGEFELFVYDAQSRGLNPLKKQIYFVKYGGKPSHQVGIDGYRAIAESTGKYDGQDETVYGDDFTYNNSLTAPEWAQATVYKKGCSRPFVARVYFKEYVQVFGSKVGSQWAQRPYHMLAKCAEALALRKAFPEQLSGLHATGEVNDDDAPVVEVKVKEPEAIEGEVQATPVTKEKPAQKAFLEPQDDTIMDSAPATPNF